MRCCPILPESCGDIFCFVFCAKNIGVIGLKKWYFGACGQELGRTIGIVRPR